MKKQTTRKKRTTSKRTRSSGANRRYKDSVFTLFFSNPDLLRNLSNALSGTDFDKQTPVTINTLSGVLFMKRKNDISFVVGDRLIVLVEHQSTLNKNMPFRFLIYIARLYEAIIDMSAVYQEALIPLLRPEFIVFYVGKEPMDDEVIMKLSEAFKQIPGF
jgi:hypothetical protein